MKRLKNTFNKLRDLWNSIDPIDWYIFWDFIGDLLDGN